MRSTLKSVLAAAAILVPAISHGQMPKFKHPVYTYCYAVRYTGEGANLKETYVKTDIFKYNFLSSTESASDLRLDGKKGGSVDGYYNISSKPFEAHLRRTIMPKLGDPDHISAFNCYGFLTKEAAIARLDQFSSDITANRRPLVTTDWAPAEDDQNRVMP